MRVLVTGGRDWGHESKEQDIIDEWIATLDPWTTMIVHGGAKGVDREVAKVARIARVPTVSFPAWWGAQGKSAGPRRNQRMLDVAEPHLVVAFPGGRGTADMIERAEKAGIPVEKRGW